MSPDVSRPHRRACAPGCDAARGRHHTTAAGSEDRSRTVSPWRRQTSAASASGRGPKAVHDQREHGITSGTIRLTSADGWSGGRPGACQTRIAVGRTYDPAPDGGMFDVQFRTAEYDSDTGQVRYHHSPSRYSDFPKA